MENNNLVQMIEEMRELTKKQIKDAYIEGAKQGAITACSILYNTFIALNIPKENIIYDFIKDIAKQNGCEDLPAAALKILTKPAEDK